MATEDIGGDLERIAGHIEGLVYALKEFRNDVDSGNRTDQPRAWPEDSGEYTRADECNRRDWLFEVLLEAVDHEAAAVREAAERMYALNRKATKPGRPQPPGSSVVALRPRPGA